VDATSIGDRERYETMGRNISVSRTASIDRSIDVDRASIDLDAGRRVDLSAPLIRHFFETSTCFELCACMGKLYAYVDGLFLSFGSGELYKSIARALLFKEKTKTEDDDDEADDEADDKGWKTDEYSLFLRTRAVAWKLNSRKLKCRV